MMVNPDADGCTKAQNHRKFLHKAQKKTTENQRNTKPKYKLRGGPSFTFSLQEGTIRPSGSSR